MTIEIRDLDQAVVGNPAHDVIRLGLSLATAARGSDLPGVTTAHILEHLMDGYCSALRQGVNSLSNRDPLFAPNRDPSWATGMGRSS